MKQDRDNWYFFFCRYINKLVTHDGCRRIFHRTEQDTFSVLDNSSFLFPSSSSLCSPHFTYTFRNIVDLLWTEKPLNSVSQFLSLNNCLEFCFNGKVFFSFIFMSVFSVFLKTVVLHLVKYGEK